MRGNRRTDRHPAPARAPDRDAVARGARAPRAAPEAVRRLIGGVPPPHAASRKRAACRALFVFRHRFPAAGDLRPLLISRRAP
ncbi:hypothetical protein BVI2075_160112 [Burkholderia vietnamiensis]|nr:hypothetical protein BVI2075_160112 [Burkholderia vietnamiensis]